MTSKLRLSDELELPAEAVTQTFGILAKRGMGKTYTAAVLAEELLEHDHQVVIVDPIGVWWGLRAAANGRDPGLPIIVIGGDHQDAPLGPDSGKVLAEFAVTTRQSLVLDLSLLRKGEQTRFMTDFAETLYHRNRAALHLILDEADSFAPQRPQKGEERMLGAVEDLVRRGRARGIGVTLVTQRAAVINKNVLTQVEVLVALRTIAPQDRAAMDAWIQAHGTPEQRATFMESLASLPVGTAWFWSPGWLDIFQKVRVRRRKTFDSSATPKAGETKAAPKKLADVDLEALKLQLASTIERAKADDPRELRKRIAELERELKAKPAAEAPKVERVEVPVLQDGQLARIEKACEAVARPMAELAEILSKLRNGHERHPIPAAAPVRSTATAAPVTARAAAMRPAPAFLKTEEAQVLGRIERALLTALAQRPNGLTKGQILIFAGYRSSGAVSTAFAKLARLGWVSGSGLLQITRAGLEALGQFESLPTGAELRNRILTEAGPMERAILTALFDAYPDAIGKGELLKRAGYKSSGAVSTAFAKIVRINYARVAGPGQLVAAEELYA